MSVRFDIEVVLSSQSALPCDRFAATQRESSNGALDFAHVASISRLPAVANFAVAGPKKSQGSALIIQKEADIMPASLRVNFDKSQSNPATTQNTKGTKRTKKQSRRLWNRNKHDSLGKGVSLVQRLSGYRSECTQLWNTS